MNESNNCQWGCPKYPYCIKTCQCDSGVPIVTIEVASAGFFFFLRGRKVGFMIPFSGSDSQPSNHAYDSMGGLSNCKHLRFQDKRESWSADWTILFISGEAPGETHSLYNNRFLFWSDWVNTRRLNKKRYNLFILKWYISIWSIFCLFLIEVNIPGLQMSSFKVQGNFNKYLLLRGNK